MRLCRKATKAVEVRPKRGILCWPPCEGDSTSWRRARWARPVLMEEELREEVQYELVLNCAVVCPFLARRTWSRGATSRLNGVAYAFIFVRESPDSAAASTF